MISRLALAGLLVALMGCSDHPEEGAQRPDPGPVVYKGPPPELDAEFEILYEGEALARDQGWEIGVERGREVKLTARMKVRDGGQICRTTFRLEDYEAPSDEWVRELRDDPRPLGPGTYAYPLSWDGTSDEGHLLPPGRYRLSATVETGSDGCAAPSSTEGHRFLVLVLGASTHGPRAIPQVPVQ